MSQTHTPMNEKQKALLENAQPMWKIVWSQFKDHRLAFVSLLVVLFFILIAAFADVISYGMGIDPNSQNVASRYLQPMTKSVPSSSELETLVEKFIAAHPEAANKIEAEISEKQLVPFQGEDAFYELAALGSEDFIKGLAQLSAPEAKTIKKEIDALSITHIFGTDEVGRDVFIRLIYSTRISMSVGLLSAIASALIGLLIGSLAGYYGGFVDTMLMRITDALLSLPTIPVLIVFAAIDLTKLPALKAFISTGNESLVKMVIILCIFSWMTVARLVRGSILSLREREFVLAAKTLGAKDSTIIFRHMFPNVMAPMMVSISLGVGESILFEAALSFLGLGIMPPTPSWGNMLNNAQEVIYNNVWLTILPGLMILLTTISFNFIGDGLQDAIDPKAIRR